MTVAPELHVAEAVKNGGVELYDADVGVVSYCGGIVKLFGVVAVLNRYGLM